uniref:L-carnitine dehydratase/bile acid-inducible protein F n=1 Tax=Sphingomonas sp. JE1 TaxID=1628059 RepID=A0A0D4ZZN9_9SPHN|nr:MULTISPECIES: CaiB/BaiF CoA-transferase family protein [unclassified Sphingomonas]AJW29589.1 L-carnitine dehydratase/bile acid-inducible protein F [Sphingomonas sp. JE1]
MPRDSHQNDHSPLAGLKVVDFSTLLPGPLASLMLVEAGADVLKVERPGQGDDMRAFEPRFGSEGAIFALLNRGKRSISLDLKNPTDAEKARVLAIEADILIEQFRPGVMARLGLSHEVLSRDNPRLIYCSITGYGQTGPKAQRAAHDLNYVAEAGMLSLVTGSDGAPTLPPIPIADIGGGSYPAFMNIMLALYARMTTGRGCHLDISMTDNVLPFQYWALAGGFVGQWADPNGGLITGGSPRYAIYRTKDGRFLAAAPLEDKFWRNLCEVLGIGEDADHARVAAAVEQLDSDALMARLEGKDVCCSLVATLEEALADEHVHARGLLNRGVTNDSGLIPALPLALAENFRHPTLNAPAPMLQCARAERQVAKAGENE